MNYNFKEIEKQIKEEKRLREEKKLTYRNTLTLEELNNKKNELNDEANRIWNEASIVEEVIFDLKKEEAIKSGAFKEAEWELNYTMERLYFNSDCRKHKKLSSLLETDYHCHIKFEYFTVSFSDGDITIHFEKFEDGLKFIKEVGIEYKAKDLEKELKLTKEKLESLENIIKIIKGNDNG